KDLERTASRLHSSSSSALAVPKSGPITSGRTVYHLKPSLSTDIQSRPPVPADQIKASYRLCVLSQTMLFLSIFLLCLTCCAVASDQLRRSTHKVPSILDLAALVIAAGGREQ